MGALEKTRKAQQKALAKLWHDRCTIIQRQKATDGFSKLTDFQERVLLADEPCKLSFEKITENIVNDAAAKTQNVKLFLSASVQVPAGCKILVRRPNEQEREFVFAASGEPAVFGSHQEIYLTLWREWA